jgi:hypothetical protein
MGETFHADCGGPYELQNQHTVSCYEAEPTSGADLAVMAFLKVRPEFYMGKRLLHVGVGNSEFPMAFVQGLGAYVGLTISLPELAQFRDHLAGRLNATAMLMNKYDPGAYGKLSGDFDIIVDTLLKSMACCEKHFWGMMEFFTSKLSQGGALLTTETGVSWGWRGNTHRGYTPGAQTAPSLAQYRVLGTEGLRLVAERLDLNMSSAEVAVPGTDPPTNDRILILTKA